MLAVGSGGVNRDAGPDPPPAGSLTQVIRSQEFQSIVDRILDHASQADRPVQRHEPQSRSPPAPVAEPEWRHHIDRRPPSRPFRNSHTAGCPGDVSGTLSRPPPPGGAIDRPRTASEDPSAPGMRQLHLCLRTGPLLRRTPVRSGLAGLWLTTLRACPSMRRHVRNPESAGPTGRSNRQRSSPPAHFFNQFVDVNSG